MRLYLGAIVIVTNADTALTTKTLGPEATNINVGLGHAGMGNEEPCTKDDLGENIEDGVGNNFAINADPAGTVGNSPDTRWISKDHGRLDVRTYTG